MAKTLVTIDDEKMEVIDHFRSNPELPDTQLISRARLIRNLIDYALFQLEIDCSELGCALRGGRMPKEK